MSTNLCPICSGSGKYTPPWDGETTACPLEEPCWGCNGKGWGDTIVRNFPKSFSKQHEESTCTLCANKDNG